MNFFQLKPPTPAFGRPGAKEMKMTEFYSKEALSGSAKTLDAVGLDIGATPQLRRGPNGGIDYEYYLARGRAERSKAAHGFFGAIGRGVKRLFTTPARVEPTRLHHV